MSAGLARYDVSTVDTAAGITVRKWKFWISVDDDEGHSPRSVADRHYNDPDSTILDDCIGQRTSMLLLNYKRIMDIITTETSAFRLS